MRNCAIFLSLLGLFLTVVPSVFVFYGMMAWKVHTQLVFIGMVLWFVCAPMWMKEKSAGA